MYSSVVCVCFSLHLAPVTSQTADEAQTAPADPASPNLSKSFTLGNATDMRVSTSCHTHSMCLQRVCGFYAYALCMCGRQARTHVSACTTHVQFALLYKLYLCSVLNHTRTSVHSRIRLLLGNTFIAFYQRGTT